MTVTHLKTGKLTNLPFYEERVDLAAAFRWTARLNMHCLLYTSPEPTRH